MHMRKNILLVEGTDEVHVLSALFMAHKLPKAFDIREEGGIDGVLDTLEVAIDDDNIVRLGTTLVPRHQ